jgi:hypothetical protein
MIHFEKAINSLERDDLSTDLQLLADLIGIENVRRIVEVCGGLRFYVPKLTHNKQFICRYINNNVHIDNIKLALELDLSINHVAKFKKTILSEQSN